MRRGDAWQPIKRLHGSRLGTLPPQVGPSSELVWLLFADGRRALGSCTFRPRAATFADAVHHWSMLPPFSSAGSAGHALAHDDPQPIAWQPVIAPPAPPPARCQELRDKVEA